MSGQMENMENGFNLFFNPLGSRYHTFSTGELPLNTNSVGYLFAIECTDEEAFGNALSLTLPMLGATLSDFLGNQLFTDELIDKKHLFIILYMNLVVFFQQTLWILI